MVEQPTVVEATPTPVTPPASFAPTSEPEIEEVSADEPALLDEAAAIALTDQVDDEELADKQERRKQQAPSDIEKIAIECLEGLLERMDIEATVTTRVASDLVEPGEEAPLVLDIIGNDLGILIGRRSETLQAIQYMVRLMVSKRLGTWQRIVVDVESYRARRRRSLRQMAERMAERAVANRERVVMEAMSAYERRIIHVALRDHPAVFTKSIGRENNRKVTIIPK
jgi:spoIIIJ-associated protein